SLSSFGASLATCSVSRLTLTAPSLDFELVEDLADYAAEEALQAGILDVRETPDRFFLVAVQQASTALLRAGFPDRVDQLRFFTLGDAACPRRVKPCADIVLGMGSFEGD